MEPTTKMGLMLTRLISSHLINYGLLITLDTVSGPRKVPKEVRKPRLIEYQLTRRANYGPILVLGSITIYNVL